MKIKLLSYLIVALFCWIIWPYKWVLLAQNSARLANAKRRADALDAAKNQAVYVVQYRRRFKVGLRADFRRENSKVRRDLAQEMKGFLKWDYRNAIVYRTR